MDMTYTRAIRVAERCACRPIHWQRLKLAKVFSYISSVERPTWFGGAPPDDV